jgi:hypothetical protein
MDKQYYIDNHIGLFKNFMPNEMINNYIDYFNRCEKHGAIYFRKEDEILASDGAVDTIKGSSGVLNHTIDVPMTYTNKPFIDLFFNEVYPIYNQKYSYLKSLASHTILDVKIQKTKIGGGYHTWHCENAEMKARNRILAFMVYLNDVNEGGETEFLYQKCRFKPEKNTLLVWPSQFTHIHRGNPPLSNDKYIITGWVEYGY